jgi:hypothetical protein
MGDKTALENYARAGAGRAGHFGLSKAMALWKEALTR